MKSYKLPKDIKIRMEREIRQYDENKKRLQKLKKMNTNTTSRYLYLEERLRLVEIAYNRLTAEEKKIYNIIFKRKCNWLYCQNIFLISRSTYYNVYNKSIVFLAEEFGEI